MEASIMAEEDSRHSVDSDSIRDSSFYQQGAGSGLNSVIKSSEDIKSDTSTSPVCSGCELDGKKLPATGLCVICSDYLCSMCIQHHKKVKLTRNHSIQLLTSSTTRDTKSDSHQILVDFCDKPGHGDKLIEFFCASCKVVLCALCSNKEHRKCDLVLYLPDIADDIDNNPNIIEFDAKTRQMNYALNTTKEQIDKNTSLIEEYSENAKIEINRNKDIIKKHFEDIATAVEKDVDMIKKKSLDSMVNVTKMCDSVSSHLAQLRQQVGSGYKDHEQLQRFIKIIKNRKFITEIEKECRQFADTDIEIPHYEFILEQKLRTSVSDFPTFGRLDVTTPTEAKKIGVIKVRTHDNRFVCNITGLTILNGTSLIAIDRNKLKFGNNMIKHIHAEKWNIISEIETVHTPFDVTSVSNNAVAVTLSHEGIISFFNISKSGKLKMSKSITVGKNCHGLCHVEGQLVVTFDSPVRKVKIFDLEGTLLYDVSKNENGEELFANPFYTAYNIKKKLIHVSDYDKGAMVNLNMEGKVVSVMDDFSFGGPLGVVVDPDGRILVCAAMPPSVCEIIQKGVRVIAGKDNGLVYPRCIAYSEKTRCLYIGTGVWGEDDIHVFELKAK